MDFDDRLDEALDRSRRDRAVFSVLTVLLTPPLLAGSAAAVVWAFHYADLPVIDFLGWRHGFLTAMTLFLLFMFISFFARPKARWQVQSSDLAWVGGAAAALAVALALGHGTSLPETRPGLFWPVYGFLVLAIFALLGRAYQAQDSYYLGWFNGWMDDPFTIQDDLDRGHLALGCAAALPGMLFDAYGELFGGARLLLGPSDAERRAAGSLLRAVRADDAAAAKRALAGLDSASAARVVHRLESAELLRMSSGRPVLAREGEALF